MKPVFAKVLEGLENETYATRVIKRPFFATEFHFHIECQLNYIVKSSGHKIIGDCVENFEPGELTLLGSHIPHVWYNSQSENNTNRTGNQQAAAHSVALFFQPEKMMQHLSGFFNIHQLQQVLETARRGMKFHGTTRENLKALLLKMAHTPAGPSKLILLLEMIQVLCSTKEFTLLTGTGYVNTYNNRDNPKMDKLFKYVFDNFSADISLEQAAALAHMNKQAFCRYFKSRTQRSFIEFVNEVRITQACKLIALNEQPIANIAYACGFNSLSNFNRFFKKMKGVTPRAYKIKFDR